MHISKTQQISTLARIIYVWYESSSSSNNKAHTHSNTATTTICAQIDARFSFIHTNSTFPITRSLLLLELAEWVTWMYECVDCACVRCSHSAACIHHYTLCIRKIVSHSFALSLSNTPYLRLDADADVDEDEVGDGDDEDNKMCIRCMANGKWQTWIKKRDAMTPFDCVRMCMCLCLCVVVQKTMMEPKHRCCLPLGLISTVDFGELKTRVCVYLCVSMMHMRAYSFQSDINFLYGYKCCIRVCVRN